MFKSFEFVRMSKNNVAGIYKLIDDDFECELESNGTWLVAMVIGICVEYNTRKLDAGKNLALAIIWCSNWQTKSVIDHYEFMIERYIDNWNEIKDNMNDHYKKMMVWV